MKSLLFVFCFLLILHAALSTEVAPDWGCLSGYHYYRTVNITASEAVEDGEYPFTLDTASEVSAGRLQSSGYDMIFTDTTGCVKYCFFIELTTMNTEETKVWVRIPGTITPPFTLLWVYGNSGKAAADSSQSGSCAFNFFADFSTSSTYSSATSKCTVPGTIFNVTTIDSTTSLDWVYSGGFNADVNFSTVNTVWTFEAFVTSVHGQFPGVYAYNSNTHEGGYGLISEPGKLYLAHVWELDADSSTCNSGWDWLLNALPYYQPFPVIWSFTWLNKTRQLGEQRLPDGTLVHSNESNYNIWNMTEELTFFVGGIESGEGGMSISWMRARKYNPTAASSSPGILQTVESSADTLHSFLFTFIQLITSSVVTELTST